MYDSEMTIKLNWGYGPKKKETEKQEKPCMAVVKCMTTPKQIQL